MLFFFFPSLTKFLFLLQSIQEHLLLSFEYCPLPSIFSEDSFGSRMFNVVIFAGLIDGYSGFFHHFYQRFSHLNQRKGTQKDILLYFDLEAGLLSGLQVFSDEVICILIIITVRQNHRIQSLTLIQPDLLLYNDRRQVTQAIEYQMAHLPFWKIVHSTVNTGSNVIQRQYCVNMSWYDNPRLLMDYIQSNDLKKWKEMKMIKINQYKLVNQIENGPSLCLFSSRSAIIPFFVLNNFIIVENLKSMFLEQLLKINQTLNL